MRCRRCGRENKANARFCVYCHELFANGTNLNRNDIAANRNVNRNSNNYVNGRNNGNVVHRGTNGKNVPIRAYSRNASSQKEKSFSEKMIFGTIIGLGVILFGLIIGVIAMSMTGYNPNKNYVRHTGGGGGGIITSTPSSNKEYTINFNLNYDGAGTAPESQIVKHGEYVTSPEIAERKGYFFGGWYVGENTSQLYDFSQPVNQDYDLSACWVDLSDKRDSDNDGLTDVIEQYFYGTDHTKSDTDGDGLNDYFEVMLLGSNPLKQDTDGDGKSDAAEDDDDDNLSNYDEMIHNTNPLIDDSDGDGLMDGNEVHDYGTDPTKYDTDGDGASDGAEITYSTDPFSAQKTFKIKLESDDIDTVKTAVEITVGGSQVDSLKLTRVDDTLRFPKTLPGYIGAAYDFDVDGAFTSAYLSFEFTANAADPVIYYYREDLGQLQALSTTVSSGVASATVTQCGKYILIDREVYEETFEWEDVWTSTGNYQSVEIVLVVDDSGSMRSSDSENERLSVAKTLINDLPEDSKIGVVLFDDYTQVLTPELTVDREYAKSFLNDDYFDSSGDTYMYTAINNAMELYESMGDNTVFKIMVVLSDGQTFDADKHYRTVGIADENDVHIYTVGLGEGSSEYFEEYLRPLSYSTGAAFYYASDAEQLSAIYKDISKKIDIETDSDADGLPDYYEENLVMFNGVKIKLDKHNPDSDNDGVPDGAEVVVTYRYNADKTQVVVTGKFVSDPSKPDTDNDGIKDDLDTAPFERGLKDGIVGALTICSYGNGGRSSGGISGHAYLVYTSFIDDTVSVYGIKVDNEFDTIKSDGERRSDTQKHHDIYMDSNTCITLGTWSNFIPDRLRGTWINQEFYDIGNAIPSDQKSLTKYVTDEQVSIIEAMSYSHCNWTEWYNCSYFATEVWNAVFGDGLSAQAVWCSPDTLSYNIEKRGGKTAADMLAPMPPR